MTETQTAEILLLDPANVLADDNTRFNLKRTRLDSLKNNILEVGEVLQPVEVTELDEPIENFTHRLTSGFYRRQAVQELNAEQNAGLFLPAIVRSPADDTDRVKHQLSENMERENQSPMDKAIAIRKLQSLGVANPEIRRIFSAAGGRKGNTVQPMSNAMMNIHLRFLELPKAIQEKIHDGRVGVAAAYELGKVPPDKRQAVLDAAEAERLKQIEREEKDEQRYLDTEKKHAEAQHKTAEVENSVEKLRAAVNDADAMLKLRKKELDVVKEKPYLQHPEGSAERRAVIEELKAGENNLKGAEKILKDLKNELSRMLKEKDKAVELAAKRAEELAAARKAVKAAPKKVAPIGQDEVKKAAKSTGASTGAVALGLAEIRDAIKELNLPSNPPKVKAIGAALRYCFDGNSTYKELVGILSGITGEGPALTAPVKAAPAPAATAADKAPKAVKAAKAAAPAAK